MWIDCVSNSIYKIPSKRSFFLCMNLCYPIDVSRMLKWYETEKNEVKSCIFLFDDVFFIYCIPSIDNKKNPNYSLLHSSPLLKFLPTLSQLALISHLIIQTEPKILRLVTIVSIMLCYAFIDVKLWHTNQKKICLHRATEQRQFWLFLAWQQSPSCKRLSGLTVHCLYFENANNLNNEENCYSKGSSALHSSAHIRDILTAFRLSNKLKYLIATLYDFLATTAN